MAKTHKPPPIMTAYALPSLWFQCISDAERQTQLTLSDEVKSYLILTLHHYMTDMEVTEHILAIGWLNSLKNDEEKHWRMLADTCLLRAGLWPHARQCQPQYICDIGQQAYLKISKLHAKKQISLSHLYSSMSDSFEQIVTVLQSINQEK